MTGVSRSLGRKGARDIRGRSLICCNDLCVKFEEEDVMLGSNPSSVRDEARADGDRQSWGSENIQDQKPDIPRKWTPAYRKGLLTP